MSTAVRAGTPGHEHSRIPGDLAYNRSMRAQQPVTEVPDVVGCDAADACVRSTRAGFVRGGPHPTEAPSDGVVASQRPLGNAGAERGSKVTVWAHGGRKPAEELVPAGPVGSGDIEES